MAITSVPYLLLYNCFWTNKTEFYCFFLIFHIAYQGSCLQIFQTRSSNTRVNFLACRVINVWNSLPDSVSFTSLAVFKRSIRTVDFSEFLICNNV